MSTEAMKWAIEQAPPMPPQLIGALMGLAWHADKHGRGAYPSLARLAAYTCKSERSVRRDLRELEDLKLIRPGDQSKANHLPPDKRPTVYDLAVENRVPKGRAGDDEGTRTSARTLASARARGGRQKPTSGINRGDVDVRADADVRGDVDVTSGGTPTSQREDVDVTDGGTWTSAEPTTEPPENQLLNQWGAEDYPNHPPRDRAEQRPDSRPTPAPIDDAGFALTDSMRAWALRTFGPALDLDFETAQFLDHHRANNSRRPNWPAEWQKWIRRSAKYASERATRPPLRAVSGDYQPFQCPPATAYANDKGF